jgi:hypothetical protein
MYEQLDPKDAALAKANARIMQLERALLLLFEAYEGVYDMKGPPPIQSDAAKRAEGMARDALALSQFIK